MIIKQDTNKIRAARHRRIRSHLSGTAVCPRLCVYRSASHIYAQVIDDVKGNTIVSASTVEKNFKANGKSKSELAALVGENVAKKAVKKGVKKVVFDRGGYLYTGRVAALADGARKGGLEF